MRSESLPFRELKFLLDLVKQPSKHSSRKRLEGLNWNLVGQYAERNKIIPFFAHLVSCKECQKKIPLKVLATINQSYFNAASLRDLQEKEKRRLGRAFAKKKIELVLLKDYSAWGLKYPQAVFPQKVDIDFFALSQNCSWLHKVMLDLGYRPIKSHFPKDLNDKFARLEKDYCKKIDGADLILNLHFRDALPETHGRVNPLNRKAVRRFTRLFVGSLRRNPKNGFFLPLLELNLISLCLHFFFRDQFTGLKTLYEIDQITHQLKREIKWVKILHIVQELEVESYFLFVMKIASAVFTSPLPKALEIAAQNNPRVNYALKPYSPFLTVGVEDPREWLNPKVNRNFRAYRFLIKLILWQKPLVYKLGPRVILFFFIYFLPTYILLKKNQFKA